MKLKSKSKHVVELSDWDNFIKEVYGKPYSFQQQEGYKMRGIWEFNIPFTDEWDYEEDIPDIPVGDQQLSGVKFQTWLDKDPNEKFFPEGPVYADSLYWERNFYPDKCTLVKDLESKGLLTEGNYVINIDW